MTRFEDTLRERREPMPLHHALHGDYEAAVITLEERDAIVDALAWMRAHSKPPYFPEGSIGNEDALRILARLDAGVSE